jgi:hypothetical protein
MPRRKRTPEEPQIPVFARVESYDVRSSVGFNIHLLGRLRDDLPDGAEVFESTTVLIILIRGVFYEPTPRSGEHVEFTVYGERASRWPLRIKDIHARDKNESHMYRIVRGQQVPVLNIPKGVTTIERRRSDNVWAAWVFVEPRLVTDMLLVLAAGRQTYLSLYVKKADRRRWVTDMTLQTGDPATEDIEAMCSVGSLRAARQSRFKSACGSVQTAFAAHVSLSRSQLKAPFFRGGYSVIWSVFRALSMCHAERVNLPQGAIREGSNQCSCCCLATVWLRD